MTDKLSIEETQDVGGIRVGREQGAEVFTIGLVAEIVHCRALVGSEFCGGSYFE
jgi:hypothetical protein